MIDMKCVIFGEKLARINIEKKKKSAKKSTVPKLFTFVQSFESTYICMRILHSSSSNAYLTYVVAANRL